MNSRFTTHILNAETSNKDNKVKSNQNLFFFKIIYSWDRERERQREKGAPHKEPDVGLNPILGSHPVLKADAQPLNHPGIPSLTKI